MLVGGEAGEDDLLGGGGHTLPLKLRSEHQTDFFHLISIQMMDLKLKS